MAPELVTAEYFEKCKAMTEPVVIPAHLNPRPNLAGSEGDLVNAGLDADDGQERTLDVGQDKLGMVIPQGLTVRKVAELVGEDTKLPVIDVKTQQSADWKLSQWVDYYENEDENKSIRNVISLEVSKTKLGRLIRRPDVVRDLDLADAVWPNDGVGPPPVQFYVLMSAEDCYTDFHIDFGGSSVYYHILKGQKTFFFIPPKPSHLKRYEEWNMSPSQNHTWLGHVTKECYRVDLSEGDTMLIPSGWIHSVWTPKNSLVIGGNFLTRLSYPNQIRITEIEKTTGVPKKFKYPHFQKIMWLQVLQYLERDPVPAYVEALLIEGKQFPREVPLYREYNKFGHNSDPGPENYNARYYPQAELDGLPRLVAYIFRTVMIALGRMDNIPLSTIAAVEKSIPTKLDYAADNARRFALWVAWKRGNETIPDWAYPDIELPNYNKKALGGEKQLSAAASKRQERQAALDLHHAMNADIRTARQRSSRVGPSNPESRSGSPSAYNPNHYASPKNSVLGPKRSACDACRKRRVACKHKDEVTNAFMVNGQRQYEFVAPSAASASSPAASASNGRMLVAVEVPSRYEPSDAGDFDSVAVVTPDRPVASSINVTTSTSSANNSGGPRNRACANCRKSKVCSIYSLSGRVNAKRSIA